MYRCCLNGNSLHSVLNDKQALVKITLRRFNPNISGDFMSTPRPGSLIQGNQRLFF